MQIKRQKPCTNNLKEKQSQAAIFQLFLGKKNNKFYKHLFSLFFLFSFFLFYVWLFWMLAFLVVLIRMLCAFGVRMDATEKKWFQWKYRTYLRTTRKTIFKHYFSNLWIGRRAISLVFYFFFFVEKTWLVLYFVFTNLYLLVSDRNWQWLLSLFLSLYFFLFFTVLF